MKIFNLPLPSATAEIGVSGVGGLAGIEVRGASEEPPHETKTLNTNAKKIDLIMNHYFRVGWLAHVC